MSDERNLPTVLSRMLSRITEYLDSGGLWNPELADHAAVCDLILDARDEIVRLRGDRDNLSSQLRICTYNHDGWKQRAERFERKIAGLQEESTLVVAERDRLERILAALREPSEQVKKAVGRDEFMRLFTGEWETIPVGYDLTAAMILAAVEAAEQEVGNV